MDTETRLIKNKLGLLKLAEEIVRFDGVNQAMFHRHASIWVTAVIHFTVTKNYLKQVASWDYERSAVENPMLNI